VQGLRHQRRHHGQGHHEPSQEAQGGARSGSSGGARAEEGKEVEKGEEREKGKEGVIRILFKLQSFYMLSFITVHVKYGSTISVRLDKIKLERAISNLSLIPMDLKHLLEEVHPLEQRNNSTAPTLQSADFRVEIGRKDKRLLCNVISQHFLQLRCVLSPLRIHVNVLHVFRRFLKRCVQDTVVSPLRLRSDPFPLIKSMFALHSAGNGLLKAAVVRVGNVATEFLILQLQR
jgi:hypothetical protein